MKICFILTNGNHNSCPLIRRVVLQRNGEGFKIKINGTWACYVISLLSIDIIRKISKSSRRATDNVKFIVKVRKCTTVTNSIFKEGCVFVYTHSGFWVRDEWSQTYGLRTILYLKTILKHLNDSKKPLVTDFRYCWNSRNRERKYEIVFNSRISVYVHLTCIFLNIRPPYLPLSASI